MACSPSSIQAPLWFPSVLAERKEPEWTQKIQGITIVEFTMDLDLDLLVLIDHLHHSRELASFYAWCMWKNHTNVYFWL